MSGGIDSRLLLALLPSDPSQLHVIGPAQHPDSRVAKAIAKQQHMSLRHVDEPAPDLDTALAQLQLRSRLSFPVSPASATPRMLFYKRLHQEGYAAIGGGFGEIARRHYLNRLVLMGGWKGPPGQSLLTFRKTAREAFSAKMSGPA